MMSDFSAIQRLTVYVETLSVPPPYSHRYSFDLKFDTAGLQAQYSLEYTDRDDLSKEEIWEEGFSDNNNFSWVGNLPSVWYTTILESWLKTKLSSEEKDAESLVSGLIITAELVDGQKIMGVPDQIDDWVYLLLELTQAVYEAAKKEYPLRIRYLEKSSDQEQTQLIITAQFLHRTLEVIQQRGKQSRQYKLDWTKAKPLLSTLYQLDFNSEQVSAKMPHHSGKYLDPGDGLWYSFEKSVTHPGNIDFIADLERELQIVRRNIL